MVNNGMTDALYKDKKLDRVDEKLNIYLVEVIMKTMRVLVTMMASSATSAFAASGMQSQESGILVYFFIGFFALIVVSQLVPAVILFIGMVRGVFSHSEKTSVNKH